MEETNSWFKDLFLNDPIPRFIYDAHTLRFIKVNQAAIIQYGYPEAEFLTKTLYDLQPVANRAKLDEALATLVGNGVYKGEVQHITKFGKIIEVELVSHPMLFIAARARVVQALDITEKKAAQANAARAQQHKEALLARSEDIITISDREGRILYVSPAFSRVLGYGPEELLNTLGKELVHPDEYELFSERAQLLRLHPGKVFPMYNLLRRKDGSYVRIEGTMINLLEDEAVHGVIANYREITQRLKDEETIQLSDAILRAVFDSSVEGFVITDNDLVIQAFNKVAKKHIFTHTKRSELVVGASMLDYVHPDRLETIRELIPRVISGESLEYNHTLDTSKGERWINYCLYPVQVDKDEIIGICIVAKDITDKISFEEQLKLSENRYRALVREGSDLINIVDFEGNYKFITEASKSRLDSRALGENAFEYVHEDDREQLRREFEMLRTVKRMRSSPYRFHVGDGQYLWMETVGTNLMDEPAVQGIVINSHEMTDTINHIKAIEERNARLEDIAWIQSHLVRAPLASILGIIEILKTSDTEIKELMPYLEQCARELDKVIGEITNKANNLTLPDDREGFNTKL